MSLISFNVFCLVFFLGIFVILSGNIIFFNIVFDYNKLKCWKIIFIFCFFVFNLFLDNWFIWFLFIIILFDVGVFKWLNIWIKVFFFVLEKLMML